MEDVAIAYGYNNLVKTVPKTVTVGRELPLNQVGGCTCHGGCAVGPVAVLQGPVAAVSWQALALLANATCPPISSHSPSSHPTPHPSHPLPLPPFTPRPPQLCELLRGECAMAGFTEILTWALCSHAENFEQLRQVGAAAATGRCGGRSGGRCGALGGAAAWPGCLGVHACVCTPRAK